MDVPELQKVRELLVSKYTKSILPDREIGVYPRLVLKLSMSCPERKLCEKYLEAIADNFGVEWKCAEDEEEVEGEVQNEEFEKLKLEKSSQVNASSSISSISTASPISSVSSLSSSESLPLPLPPSYSETIKPSAPLPMDYSKQSSSSQQQSNTNLPDFDEFTRRFEALRKK